MLPKQKEKKKEDFRFIEDYNPTGTFLINEKAMMDMKEKSIKMLNI